MGRTLLADDFPTPLGIIRCSVETDGASMAETIGLHEVRTATHHITLSKFVVENSALAPGLVIDCSRGWLWRVARIGPVIETIRICCGLIGGSTRCVGGAAGGQWQTTIGVEDGSYQVHYGTEDEEWMEFRASHGYGVPNRLQGFAFASLFKLEGLEIQQQAPAIELGEEVFLQFIAAGDKLRLFEPATDATDWDCSTWFAVQPDKGRIPIRSSPVGPYSSAR
jgi:hypothetical protein